MRSFPYIIASGSNSWSLYPLMRLSSETPFGQFAVTSTNMLVGEDSPAVGMRGMLLMDLEGAIGESGGGVVAGAICLLCSGGMANIIMGFEYVCSVVCVRVLI